MNEENKYENPHNAPYFESFQRCIVKNQARGTDYEIVLRYLECRDEILAELGVPNDDNMMNYLESKISDMVFHNKIFKKFDLESVNAG